MEQRITLDHITKIEGHAKLSVVLEKDRVKKVNLQIIEGARYFEGFLRGRKHDEVPHLSSRICGVCSQAHLITAIKCMEEALGVVSSEQTELLRELLLIGQTIQSHTLHLYFLALPDYIGCETLISKSCKEQGHLKRALKLKRLGNDIVTLIGGREVHSITLTVGGLSRLPKKEHLESLLAGLKVMKKDAVETARLFSGFEYPDFKRKTEYLALKRPNEYAMMHGDLSSSEGLHVSHERYKDYLEEIVKKYSTAKFVVTEGRGYMVGPLSRVNLNRRMMSPEARRILKESEIEFPSYSPFHNNFARALELVHLFDRAIDILENLEITNERPQDYEIRAGYGVSATEVPRGILFHEYSLDSEGVVKTANIVTPTAQNLTNIEEDLKVMLPGILNRSNQEIVLEIEKLIRSYDPCISCSTHFVRRE